MANTIHADVQNERIADMRRNGLAAPRLNAGALSRNGGAVDESGTFRQADVDPSKNQLRVPDFSGHPVPEVAQFIWMLARTAGVAPPWKVRVSPMLCAKYGSMLTLARAMYPHAQIMTTLDGNHPAPMITPEQAIEFSYVDNPGAETPRGAPLWVPDAAQRTARTL